MITKDLLEEYHIVEDEQKNSTINDIFYSYYGLGKCARMREITEKESPYYGNFYTYYYEDGELKIELIKNEDDLKKYIASELKKELIWTYIELSTRCHTMRRIVEHIKRCEDYTKYDDFIDSVLEVISQYDSENIDDYTNINEKVIEYNNLLKECLNELIQKSGIPKDRFGYEDNKD